MNHPYADIPLIVLSGVGRSGTTAVREALGRHPHIHSTGSENNVIYDIVDAARRNCTIESRRHAMRVDQVTYNGLFGELILRLLWPEPRPAAPRRLLAFTGLTPDHAEFLVQLLPSTTFVYLLRNGIEVVTSRMGFRGFADQPFTRHCEVWAQSVEMAEWGRGRGRFLLLRHEHTLDRPVLSRTMNELWSFVDLPAEPACPEHLLEICHHPTGDVGGGDDFHEALRRRADGWRRWTPGQRRQFVERCGAAMRHFGYPIPWLGHGAEPASTVEAGHLH